MDVKFVSHPKIRDPKFWEKINANIYIQQSWNAFYWYCAKLTYAKTTLTIHKTLRVIIKFSSRHDDVGGRSSIVPHMLNLTSSWRRLVNFVSRLLTFDHRTLNFHWLYTCFGFRTCPDILENHLTKYYLLFSVAHRPTLLHHTKYNIYIYIYIYKHTHTNTQFGLLTEIATYAISKYKRHSFLHRDSKGGLRRFGHWNGHKILLE
jgi:hypothetical protein